MLDLMRSAPEIIKAASKNLLAFLVLIALLAVGLIYQSTQGGLLSAGLLVLLVLLLAALGSAMFPIKQTSERVRAGFFSAIFLGCLGVGAVIVIPPDGGGQPTGQPTCALPLDPRFVTTWSSGTAIYGSLKCPVAISEENASAEQKFDRGRMVWRKQNTNKYIYVIYDGGRWQKFDDTWDPPQPEDYCPNRLPPENRSHPIRGFGKLWCNDLAVQNGLGEAIENEWGSPNTFQDFDGGVMFHSARRNDVFALLKTGQWRQ